MRTRSKIKCKVKRQWASEIYEINAKVAFLKNKANNGLNYEKWSICLDKLKELIGLFYEYCKDNVTLDLSKELIAYGHSYYFEHCSIQTLTLFVEGFPSFPSHYELKQWVAISIICRKMLAHHIPDYHLIRDW